MPRKFNPIKESDPAVGKICPICNEPLEVGQCPSLIANGPADDEEREKMEAGKSYTYTAIAEIIHWDCLPDDLKD
jgi:hypothetical protein